MLLIKKAFVVGTDGDHELTIPVRVVSKRFVTKDRMVMCWEGTTDWPCEMAEGASQSVPMREKGWVVITPMSGAGNAGMSLVQVSMLMNPGLSDERLMDFPEQARQMSELVIPSYQQIMDSYYQMLENLLLDEYLTK